MVEVEYTTITFNMPDGEEILREGWVVYSNNILLGFILSGGGVYIAKSQNFVTEHDSLDSALEWVINIDLMLSNTDNVDDNYYQYDPNILLAIVIIFQLIAILAILILQLIFV